MNCQAEVRSTGSTVLDDLAEVIGEAAAFALAEEFIGQRLYIPKSHDGEPRIARAIGEEPARKLCDAFFRTMIPFPVTVVLERCVVALVGEGLTKREIANRLRVREARVYAILKRVRDREPAGPKTC